MGAPLSKFRDAMGVLTDATYRVARLDQMEKLVAMSDPSVLREAVLKAKVDARKAMYRAQDLVEAAALNGGE